MDFDVSKDENRLFAGVLENKSGSLSWIDGIGLNYGMLTTRVVEIPGEDFGRFQGFSMFNVLLINGYDCRTLNDVQKEAVLTWVENGEHCLSEREETGIRPWISWERQSRRSAKGIRRFSWSAWERNTRKTVLGTRKSG